MMKKPTVVYDATCALCPFSDRVEVTFRGNLKADLLFVGEAPGKQEEKIGAPFKGKSGALLGKLIETLGTTRDQVYTANALRCRIYKDTDAVKDINQALGLCRTYLDTAIKKVNPKILICLGKYALKTVMGMDQILKNRGRLISSSEYGCPVFITVHPAYVLRGATPDYPYKPFAQMNMKEKLLFTDFRALRKIIKNGFKDEGLDTSGYVKGMAKDLQQIKKSRLVAIDYEANTADIHDPNFKVISLSFTTERAKSVVFMMKNQKMLKGCREILENEKIRKAVAFRPFEEIVTKKKFKFDIQGPIHDVQEMAHLCDENFRKYDLESVANIWTDMKNIKDLAEGQRQDLWEAPEPLVIRYNGGDTDATFRSYGNLRDELKKDPLLLRYYVKFVLPVQDMLAQVYWNGCRIDINALKRSEKKADHLLTTLTQKAIDRLPSALKALHEKKGLKLSRADLIIDYLFRHKAGLRLKPMDEHITPKTGMPQTTEAHLQCFSYLPFVEYLLDWKQVFKIGRAHV